MTDLPTTGVLLMGYGSPDGAADLPGYLAEVMGRPPAEDVVREYERRYGLIGGSPQMRILRSLRGKVESQLAARGRPLPVFVGTKHWAPHLADVVPLAAEAGVDRLIAVPLSPYASRWILEPYERAIEDGRRRARRPVHVEVRSGWHLAPAWIRGWAEATAAALREGPPGTVVLLSAHSLPERMRERGDPYPELVRATASAVARAARLDPWDFTYQSAGNTTEPWLGPDITEKMVEWRDRGRADQLVAPIGFVFEHLEVLYDLDIVVRAFAERSGIRYRRVPMPNDGDRLVEAIVDVALADERPPPAGSPGAAGAGRGAAAP